MDFTPIITIDSLKWERVILNIAGKIKNIDESAVSSRLNRAKAKLREMIGGGADEQDFKNR